MNSQVLYKTLQIISLLYPIALLVWSGYLLNDFLSKKKEIRECLSQSKNIHSREYIHRHFLQLIYTAVVFVFLTSCSIAYLIVFILNYSIY